MHGIPSEMGPLGFDPSMFLLSGYLLGMLAGLIMLALVIGLVTVAVVVRIGAVVYRRGIVRTGRRLRLREVLRPA